MILAQRSAATLATTLLAVLAAVLLITACTEDGPGGLPESFALTVVLDGIGVGTITSDPAGIDCGPSTTSCTADFDEGAAVILTATPAGDHAFVAWSGGATGTTTTATVDITGDVSVTAEFDDPDMAVQEIGADGGTIVSRDGEVMLEIPAGALSASTDITIERIDAADLGPEWSDMVAAGQVAAAHEFGPDGTTFSVPATVTLASRTLPTSGDTAFVTTEPLATSQGGALQDLDSLLTDVDNINGTSTSSGQVSHFTPIVRYGINPDGADDEIVKFTVVNPPREVFVGGEFSIVVHFDAPEGWEFDTGAVFEDQSGLAGGYFGPVELVSAGETGLGGRTLTYRCTDAGTVDFGLFAVVRNPETGQRRAIRFLPRVDCDPIFLVVRIVGEGSGTVTSTPPGIDCESDCEETYPVGTIVDLAPMADPGSFVVRCTELTEEEPENLTDCSVSMDDDEIVEVEFDIADTEELSTSMSGKDGRLTSDPKGIDCVLTGGVTSGTCTAQMSGDVSLTATTADGSLVTDITGDCTLTPSGSCAVHMDGPKTVHATIPETPEEAFFAQVADFLESIGIALPGFPLGTAGTDEMAALTTAATGPACPTLIGAGGEGAYVFDGCTGEIVQEYPYVGDNFYDAIALAPPAGYDGVHQILLTGQNWVHCYVEDDGSTGEGCLGSFGGAKIPDAQLIDPKDPTAGAVFVDDISFSQLRFIVFDPAKGYFDSHPDRFGHQEGVITSAAAGTPSADPTLPPNDLLVVGWKWNEEFTAKVGLLTHGQMYPEGSEFAEGTTVAELPGNDPRRVRCDLGSGICAVSDFTNDQVTVITWTGTGAPALAATTAPGAIADGPVGLDVFGNRIVAAGFNDDQYTIMEVDAAGAIISTTTAALPAGCTQPGHAMFLEDGANTVIVSCWGSGGFARIPNAF